MARRTIRFDDSLASDISKIAQEQNISDNDAIENAMRFYRDFMYMKDKATLINDEILKINKAGLESAGAED